MDDAVAEELAAKAALEGAKAELVKAKFDLDNTLTHCPDRWNDRAQPVYEGRLVSAQTDLLTDHPSDRSHVCDCQCAGKFFAETASGQRCQAYPTSRRLSIARCAHVCGWHDLSSMKGYWIFSISACKTDTGSRQARVVFPNPDRVLLPGQFVRVQFKGTLKTGAILVPQRAVQQGAKGSIVFVVGNEDKVEMREIQATSWQGKQWIVEEGLHVGDRVIVDGLHKIAPGAPVKPMPLPDPGAPTVPTAAQPQAEQAS